MFRFEHPYYLLGLLLIPLLSVFFVLMRRRRRQALERFGDIRLTERLMLRVSKIKHHLKFIMLMFALALLFIAWANPEWGTKREKVKHKSADVMIALDISQSMLAVDIKPNRLERAKTFAMHLIENLKGERIGLVFFAGNAYRQMPLTNDYTCASLFIQSADPIQAPTQGTAIGEAIDMTLKTFEGDDKHHKALIIISDGETFDDDAMQKAKEAKEAGIIVFTIGVGTSGGGLIPMDLGGGVIDYKRDEKDALVKTTLNEDMLQQLANTANGTYFNLTNQTNITDALRNEVDKLDKRDFEQRIFNEFETYYQYFLLFSILIIVFEFMLPYRKSDWLENKDVFGV